MIRDLIKKYVLPKEVDFLKGLQEHARTIRHIVEDLQECFINADTQSCQAIIDDEHRASEIRSANMNELLDAFITPIDRESIYRVITQLDWIALSIKHFILEAKAYEIVRLENGYEEFFSKLMVCADTLSQGFDKLGTAKAREVAADAQSVRDTYDSLVQLYVLSMARLARSNDMHHVFVQRELLVQLREIAKRFQVCANSLEDIVVKMT